MSSAFDREQIAPGLYENIYTYEAYVYVLVYVFVKIHYACMYCTYASNIHHIHIKREWRETETLVETETQAERVTASDRQREK